MSFMLLKSILSRRILLFFLKIIKFLQSNISQFEFEKILFLQILQGNLILKRTPYNKLRIDRLRNHFHISSYPDPFSIDYISPALNKMS